MVACRTRINWRLPVDFNFIHLLCHLHVWPQRASSPSHKLLLTALARARAPFPACLSRVWTLRFLQWLIDIMVVVVGGGVIISLIISQIRNKYFN